MRYLTLGQLIELHHRIIEPSRGGLRSPRSGAAESALAQPPMSFGGTELYPTLAERAAALCFSLVMNHPFVDGNKRIGHVAMETFLVMNGFELTADLIVTEEEKIDHEGWLATSDRFRMKAAAVAANLNKPSHTESTAGSVLKSSRITLARGCVAFVDQETCATHFVVLSQSSHAS